ncbi:MAG: HEAT repeat domain-containing protein, partial [Planctomycetes bacterium]|nr:HEAT repeat domain-containing protein [Planctomycetota bacterium]
RRAAIRYLGTVDCNYWPNAIDALSEGLRGDPSECVRFEAALALRNGCCCTKKIIKALETCVAGKNDDGFPIERSERVRAAALEALERCPRMQDDPPIKTDEKKKKLTMGEGNPSVDPKAYYKKIGEMSDEQIVASARATLVSLKDRGKIQQAGGNGVSSAPAFASSGPHRPSSLVGIVNHAFAPDASGAARPPFFAGLTRTLTGRQDFGVPARGEMGTPAKGGVARIGDPRTEIIVPALVGDANTPRPREFKASLGVEIIQPMPSGPPASGAPREGRGYITVDPAPTTLPALPEIPKIQPVRP